MGVTLLFGIKMSFVCHNRDIKRLNWNECYHLHFWVQRACTVHTASSLSPFIYSSHTLRITLLCQIRFWAYCWFIFQAEFTETFVQAFACCIPIILMNNVWIPLTFYWGGFYHYVTRWNSSRSVFCQRECIWKSILLSFVPSPFVQSFLSFWENRVTRAFCHKIL